MKQAETGMGNQTEIQVTQLKTEAKAKNQE
jgi:hypothetical protein